MMYLMTNVNVLQLKIFNSTNLMEEYYLFSCGDNDVRSRCWISNMPFGTSDMIVNKTNRRCLIYMLDDLEEFRIFKFEEICAGKGLIKSPLDKSFLISFDSTGNTFLMCMSHLKAQLPKKLVLNIDGYALSLFLLCLNSSKKYVDLVTNNLSCHSFLLSKLKDEGVKVLLSDFQISLKEPLRHVMDLTWAKMACSAVHELRQLQYAMSWLSTLGGAFSALGEEQERCAKAAGMISIEQLRIAWKLGDNIIIAQCKLYFSLSLIQRGHCRLAKKIIQDQYHAMKTSPVVDKKTVNMCKGIWARLKYEIKMRKHSKEKSSFKLSGR